MKPLEGKVTAIDLLLKFNELIKAHNAVAEKLEQIDTEVGLLTDAIHGETTGQLDS